MILRKENDIIKEWIVDKPIISIACNTYNHELYIRDTIIGFLIQKTTFPFEILIHDDASTDKTAKIVREYEAKYPMLIKPIYQVENQYSKYSGAIGKIQRYRAKGKYIALCEGDDYWTNPYKLQKQVDFLEANPEYVLCHTDADFLYMKDGRLEKSSNRAHNKKVYEGYIFDKLLEFNFIYTPTVVYRKCAYALIDYIDDFSKFKMGDYPLWLALSKLGKFKYINDPTTVYRVNMESASNSKDIDKRIEFITSAYSIKLYFMHKFNVGIEQTEHFEYEYHKHLLYLYFKKNDSSGAAKSWNIIKGRLLKLEYIKFGLYTIGTVVNLIRPIAKFYAFIYTKTSKTFRI